MWTHKTRMCSLCILTLLAFAAPALADPGKVPKLKRTIIVSPVPGNPSASGMSLLEAIAGITGATESDPWLVKLEPGIYSLGSLPLNMKAYVDLEGSGEGVTKITGVGSNDSEDATVIGATAANIRYLTIENTGGADFATALILSSVSTNLNHTTVLAFGANVTTTNANQAVLIKSGSSVVMDHVTVSASGIAANSGVENSVGSTLSMTSTSVSAGGLSPNNRGFTNGGDATLTNTVITVGPGGPAQSIFNSGSLVMLNVTALGPGFAVVQFGGAAEARNSAFSLVFMLGGPFKIGASRVDSTVGPAVANLTCVASFSGNFQPLGPNCEP